MTNKQTGFSRANISKSSAGFTIVELLLAMAVFSFVLVIIVVAFTQILQTYRAGVIAQKTQEANRDIVAQMRRDAHAAKKIEVPSLTNGDKAVCFDDAQYYFNQSNIQYSDNIATCGTAGGENLVPNQLKVLVFEPSIATSVPVTAGGSGEQLGIDLNLVTGTNTDDLYDTSNPTVCDPTKQGSQYCSTAQTTTSIGLRGAP